MLRVNMFECMRVAFVFVLVSIHLCIYVIFSLYIYSLYIHALTHVLTYTGSLSSEQSFDVDKGRKDSQHVTQDVIQKETEPNAMMQKTNREGAGERGGGDGGGGGTANNWTTHRNGERNRSEGKKEVEVWREAGRLEALRIIEFADQQARMLLEVEGTKESALLVDKRAKVDEAVHVDHGRSRAHARRNCNEDLTVSLVRLRPKTPILERLQRSSMAKYGT
jgi:hypothetical protein